MTLLSEGSMRYLFEIFIIRMTISGGLARWRQERVKDHGMQWRFISAICTKSSVRGTQVVSGMGQY